MEPQAAASKKIKKTYDWMDAEKKPKVNPVEVQTRTSPKHKIAPQPERAITIKKDDHLRTKAEEKKAKQAEARARNAAKKRNFQDALHEPSSKPLATKKQKQSSTALPSPTLTPPPLRPVKKPRKKPAPKHLELHNSNPAPHPRKTTTASPNSAAMTPKSKTIVSLSKLNAALASQLRSVGYSPTLLHSALVSPAEIAQLTDLTNIHSRGLRRSPRLTPEAVFLKKLGRQMVGGGATGWMAPSPRGAEESPNQDELDEFERAMMESPSPTTTVECGGRPGQGMGNGKGDGLFESSESEEE